MIRVGFDKPRLYFSHASNDMSHFTPSHYSTNDFFYMDLMEFVAKLQFESFDMKPNLPEEEIARIMRLLHNGQELTFTDSPWAHQMNWLIKQAGGHQLWQFNAVNSELNGYVRQVVALGEPRMKRWSWIDANIKLPLLKLTANVLNRLRKKKTDKEWANWQAFLDKVHKKSS